MIMRIFRLFDESDDGDDAPMGDAGGHAMASGGPHIPSLPEKLHMSGVHVRIRYSDGAH
jgi:hypothetical protein